MPDSPDIPGPTLIPAPGPRGRLLLGAALFLTLLPLLGLAELELKARALAHRDRLARATFDLPPSGMLRALAFGYNELGADLLWVRTIAYFADELGLRREFVHLRRYLRSIAALDPYFEVTYRYGASMIMSQGSGLTNEQIKEAIELLKRAHALFPDDYRFPLLLGSYYMHELRPASERQRRAWRRLGADWVRRAAMVGAGIPWLPALAAKIYTEQGQRDLAIHHLQELYLTSQDEKMKEAIAGKLRALRAERVADELQRAARAFREALAASPISYVPQDLFVLLAQPPLGPWSLRQELGADDAGH